MIQLSRLVSTPRPDRARSCSTWPRPTRRGEHEPAGNRREERRRELPNDPAACRCGGVATAAALVPRRGDVPRRVQAGSHATTATARCVAPATNPPHAQALLRVLPRRLRAAAYHRESCVACVRGARAGWYRAQLDVELPSGARSVGAISSRRSRTSAGRSVPPRRDRVPPMLGRRVAPRPRFAREAGGRAGGGRDRRTRVEPAIVAPVTAEDARLLAGEIKGGAYETVTRHPRRRSPRGETPTRHRTAPVERQRHHPDQGKKAPSASPPACARTASRR